MPKNKVSGQHYNLTFLSESLSTKPNSNGHNANKWQKRKIDHDGQHDLHDQASGRHLSNGTPTTENLDTSKPTALFQPVVGGRKRTLTLALPGSIIANAKSHDQKTFLVGSIARALAVFCVDEVVVFDDGSTPPDSRRHDQAAGDENEYTAFSSPNHFLAHVLSYLETPPHLRKHLFPMHPNLRTAGTLPSLDMPHHLRKGEWSEYREGVTITFDTASQSRSLPKGRTGGTFVDAGLPEPVFLEGVRIPPQTRVTLRMVDASHPSPKAEAVSPETPRETSGYYWGYTVRRCKSLYNVLSESPYDGGYDLSFGTSERGLPLSQLLHSVGKGSNASKPIPEFSHMLIVLGGVAGLETAARNDPDLHGLGIEPGNIGELFDYWVNLCPGQGSRTIRTEEAVWLSLMGLKDVFDTS